MNRGSLAESNQVVIYSPLRESPMPVSHERCLQVQAWPQVRCSRLGARRLRILLALAIVGAAFATPATAQRGETEFFENKIRPLLVASCYDCHTGQKLGGLRVDSRQALLEGGEHGPAIVAGNAEASLLILAVRRSDASLTMPKSADKLSDEQIADLVRWIDMDAPWPEAVEVAEAGAGTQSEDTGIEDAYVISEQQRAWWAFQPLGRPTVPIAEGAATDVDRFVMATLASAGLEPSAPASRRHLLRRATYDLIGLPPTLAESEAFEADTSPDAFSKIVDRLLESPHYGERWGRHWLDVVRFGEDDTRGLAEDGTGVEHYPTAYTYRDWVIEAFNTDMPYDRFVKGQLSADLLPEEERKEMLAGLGFLGGGPWYYDMANPPVARADERHDRVDVTTRGFLGLTVGCARCHDHKYDPIPITDYYSLAGVFYNTDYHEYPLSDPQAVEETKKQKEYIESLEKALKKYLETESEQLARVLSQQSSLYMMAAWNVAGEPEMELQKAADEARLDLEALQRWIRWLGKEPKHYPFFADWQAMIADSGGTEERAQELADGFQRQLLTLVVEQEELKEKNEWIIARGSDTPPDERKSVPMPNEFESFFDKHQLELASLPREKFNLLIDLFQKDLDGIEDRYNPDPGLFVFRKWGLERRLGKTATAHIAAMRAEIEKLKEELPKKSPFVLGVKDKDLTELTDLELHLRGSPTNLGPKVPRHFLSVLSEEGAARFSEGSGRLQLAEAIAAHALTSRVLVNRVWRWHFGTGIVDTPSNFGRIGDRPSHPELLDHLARRFEDSGRSIKALHREIMLTDAYQRSTEHSKKNYAKDPGNRLYWRANRRRLDAEAVRDTLLFVSGNLDEELGGPSLEIADEKNNRRTVYSRVSRFRLDDYLQTFDFANPSLTIGKRFATNVPQQNLYFMNSEFVERQARNLRNRLEGKPPNESGKKDDEAESAAEAESAPEFDLADDQKITLAYNYVYGRQPTDEEIRLGKSFLAESREAAPDDTRAGWVQYARVLFSANEFRFLD